MYSEPFTCEICGLVLINQEKLAEHRAAVHIDGRLQCQSCGSFYDDKASLDLHATEVHSASSQSDFAQKSAHEQRVDDAESMLLKRTMEEEKARKRTRGPYRKSAAA